MYIKHVDTDKIVQYILLTYGIIQVGHWKTISHHAPILLFLFNTLNIIYQDIKFIQPNEKVRYKARQES